MAEPPLSYSLTIDGQSYAVEAGKPLKIDGSFTNPRVELVVGDVRLFNFEGVRFKYPAQFSFKAERNAALSSWALTGEACEQCILYLYLLAEPIDPAQFGRLLAAQYQNADGTVPERVEATRELGELSLAGVKLEAVTGAAAEGQGIVQEIYQPDGEGGRRLLILQYPSNLDELPEAQAAEINALLASLEASFAYAAPVE